ncbi:hypothetical protein [Deinococcus gobiensis]|uniref:Uncharacterized protein n=1 Tax=Deinococcus gobiensis (strain DSM 21396 / JCM 16679 / CGMCC 1.7299 / I-0) TaxID=745776 RepID=H8H2S2_DEIGI|nr:hypothetical protein [Deinococcus gobiensis]AFD27819.1 hypothetical protein DGo_PC0027 [Deinococcus gobiensis I-0]
MDPFPALVVRLHRLVQQLHAYLDLDALHRHTQPELSWLSTADLDALLCTAEVLHAALRILPALAEAEEPSAADEDLLMLIQDLARTLAERQASNLPLSRDLEEAVQWDIRPGGVTLTLEEVSGAAAFLIAHYRGHGLEQALLGPLGLVLPPAPACFPPRTNPATRLPRGAERHPELHVLTTGPQEDVAICAALLLWCLQRAEEPEIEVLSLLTAARNLICVVQDQAREQKRPPQAGALLLQVWKQIHAELGQPRLVCGKVPVIRQVFRERVQWVALNELRRAWLIAQGWKTSAARQIDTVIEEQFDVLEKVLTLLEAPEDIEHIERMLQLTTILVLSRTPRVPGQQLPVLVELLCDLTETDPLWDWTGFDHLYLDPSVTKDEREHRRQKELPQVRANLSLQWALQVVHPVLDLYPRAHETHLEEVCWLLQESFGHLFACARQRGVQIPGEAQWRSMLEPLGWMRASPLTVQEQEQVRGRLHALSTSITAAALQAQQEETSMPAEEIVAPEAVEWSADLDDQRSASTAMDASVDQQFERPQPQLTPPRPEAPHVLQARALLAGRPITLIGGVPSEPHKLALERALEVRVDWIPSMQYQHGAHAGKHVTEETAAVILAIRWMGHAHMGLRDIARAQGVPCVMLPSGLNPSNVAWHLVEQVGHQLSGGERLEA